MTTRRAALAQAMRAALVCSTGGLTTAAHANLQEKPKPSASADSSAASDSVRASLRGAPRLVGQHRFTYWGFEVYDASLWSNTAFVPEDWAKQRLVLELRYLRDFKGTDIAQRSIDEMHGQRALSAAQKQAWLATLVRLIPNVRNGERLSGVYAPDKGMQLFHQDRLVGEVADLELAQRFFGIWLAPETSQRQLRQQLLAGAQP
jgi:hypothetical protein